MRQTRQAVHFSTADAVADDGLFDLALGGGKLWKSGQVGIAQIAKKATSRLTETGIKESRRPDIIYKTKEGGLKGVNVGRTKADGTPVTREQRALQDLNGPGKLPTKFVPYD